MYGSHFLSTTKRLAVVLMSIVCLLSLFGCKQAPTEPEGFVTVQDSSGSIAPTPWYTLDLSRSDMYYPHNFHFSVTLNGDHYLATGYCVDEDGNRYEPESPVEIPLEVIDLFDFDTLPDYKDKLFGNAFLLDAPSVSITLTYIDGTQKEKAADDSLSLELYQALLPYFANHEAQPEN